MRSCSFTITALVPARKTTKIYESPFSSTVASNMSPPVTEAVVEENDQTGDSGMGTGSGSANYGTCEVWKNAMNNPPPGINT